MTTGEICLYILLGFMTLVIIFIGRHSKGKLRKPKKEDCRYYFKNEQGEDRCCYYPAFCNGIEDCKVYARKR